MRGNGCTIEDSFELLDCRCYLEQMTSTLPESDDGAFLVRAEVALRGLFVIAHSANELHFAQSLSPEFRGLSDAGWNTAHELMAAVDDYVAFFKSAAPSRVNARIALGFYSHLAEASGFYEVPKNMLRVAEGLPSVVTPFRHLVKIHETTGEKIAPNANKVMRDLVGHSATLGLTALSEVFRDAFDADVRNGYAHADYVLWRDEIRLPRRNGGRRRTVPFDEFQTHFRQ
jgi:hypothetical protein